jgi:ankyrin repeat protein
MRGNLPRPHERLEISKPCSAQWDSMAGSKRVRFCAHCRLHVHNLSEVTPREAMRLVMRSGGRLCLRIERDQEGAPRTRARALAGPLYQIKRRASRLAAGAFGAALTLCASAAAQAQTTGPEPAQQTVVTVNPDAITELPIQIERNAPVSGLVALVGPSEPLVKAAMANDLETVRHLLLFEGADVNVLDKNLGVTALAQAYANGNREMIRELLWRGARVNERLSYKATALMHMNADTTVEVVRDLLDAGARVNLQDEEGNTALMVAVEFDRTEVVEVLLKAGARVNARNKAGRTALMLAAIQGSAETIRALINEGADISLRDKEGHSALWHARDNDEDEAASLLLAYGAYEEPEEKQN